MMALIPIERSQITSAVANAISPAVPLDRTLSAEALIPSKTCGSTRGLIAGAIELRHVLCRPSAPSRPNPSNASGITAMSARNPIAEA
jgi:hypothetical protein